MPSRAFECLASSASSIDAQAQAGHREARMSGGCSAKATQPLPHGHPSPHVSTPPLVFLLLLQTLISQDFQTRSSRHIQKRGGSRDSDTDIDRLG
eukprot:234966-Rhodomonas_salina.3